MPQILDSTQRRWTASDLVDRFGPIPLDRIRFDPFPGTATREDVVRIHDHEDVLCELVDGVLVEKAMGWFESYLAVTIASLMHQHVTSRNLGVVLGADGLLELNPALVRIPDVCFINWKRFAEAKAHPENAFLEIGPNLAVEVLSKSNTRKEMASKLEDYFNADVDLVWYVDPRKREVTVFTAVDASVVLAESDELNGGDVLPGFRLSLQTLFEAPEPPA